MKIYIKVLEEGVLYYFQKTVSATLVLLTTICHGKLVTWRKM